MIFTDQMGRQVELVHQPRKIISLVPSQTELLFDLGLDSEIIGITKFCIHPRDKFLSTQKIGGTKTIDIEKILELQPDLIIGNKEENDREQILELQKHFPVWMSDIVSIEDNNTMILALGKLLKKEEESKALVAEIRAGFLSAKQKRQKEKMRRRVAYFIWYNPLMMAGRSTFINSVLEEIGLENACTKERYPEMDFNQVREMTLDVVYLSSEPFPFKEKHVEEFKKVLPNVEVKIVDGEMFSWYGSRMRLAAKYFESLN